MMIQEINIQQSSKIYAKIREGGVAMERLDLKRLSARPSRIVSSEDALKNVTPFDWPKEVIAGKKRVVIENAEINEEKQCAKLEISS